MNRTRIKQVLSDAKDGESLVIKGWIRTRRDSKGGFSFLEINDGSCLANLQVIADKDLTNYQDTVQKLYSGCSVVIEGTIKSSQGGKQKVELHATKVEELGESPPEEFVIGKQRVSFEVLRDIPHLRTRTNTFGAMARVRSQLAHSIHEFFQSEGFLYIHTPIITGNDCEGAGEMFRVTTFDLEEQAIQPKPYHTENDFFKKQVNLTVSGQLELESYACSMGDVYSFGPTFRAENSHTSRHLAEFWMVEPEMAFADINDNMLLAEQLLKHCFKQVLSNCQEDMEFFNLRIDKTVIETLEAIEKSSFKHITYTEAIEILEKSKKIFENQVSWGGDLQSEHEKYLTEEVFKGPVIVTDYPVGIKAFYMKLNADEKTVRGMDVLLPKVGEMIGGAQREDNLETLIKRMKKSGINPDELSWYLDLRKFGNVPHAGFGLGFERLVQFVTGLGNIRDVIPFPRTAGHMGI